MQTKHFEIHLLLLSVFTILFFTSCNNAQIAVNHGFPTVAHTQSIAIYNLNNYTDTPRAGMRASNITEGLLLAKGYRVKNRATEATRKMTLSEKLKDAKQHHADYLLTGGVSEWRYKTGIDGEPAVSLQLKLVNVHSGNVVWSATGSDNSWGNASIGVVSQELISKMLSSTSR